jgi:hypothetical protein
MKYMNQLTVIAAIAVKTAGKPLGNFDRKGMEKIISQSIQQITPIIPSMITKSVSENTFSG